MAKTAKKIITRCFDGCPFYVFYDGCDECQHPNKDKNIEANDYWIYLNNEIDEDLTKTFIPDWCPFKKNPKLTLVFNPDDNS